MLPPLPPLVQRVATRPPRARLMMPLPRILTWRMARRVLVLPVAQEAAQVPVVMLPLQVVTPPQQQQQQRSRLVKMGVL